MKANETQLASERDQWRELAYLSDKAVEAACRTWCVSHNLELPITRGGRITMLVQTMGLNMDPKPEI